MNCNHILIGGGADSLVSEMKECFIFERVGIPYGFFGLIFKYVNYFGAYEGCIRWYQPMTELHELRTLNYLFICILMPYCPAWCPPTRKTYLPFSIYIRDKSWAPFILVHNIIIAGSEEGIDTFINLVWVCDLDSDCV